MDLRIHGCVKAESRVLRNPHARFGGRRLETQVRLCAGRLPYFLLFSDNKRELMQWRDKILKRLEGFRLTLHEESVYPKPVAEGIPFLGFQIFPEHRRLKPRKGYAFRRKLCRLMMVAPQEKIKASVQGWINHVRYADTHGLRRSMLNEFGLLAKENGYG